ncbi:hypothetical protein HOH51_01755 [bacterium]|nr:hypothetical protein [bacterium]
MLPHSLASLRIQQTTHTIHKQPLHTANHPHHPQASLRIQQTTHTLNALQTHAIAASVITKKQAAHGLLNMIYGKVHPQQ